MSGETTKALESIIGRLNHAAYVIPLSRHFLDRLRSRLERMGPTHPNQTFRLTTDEIKDAELCVTFLAQARSGISLNCLTLRQPSQVAISDSCPFGLDGFTWSGKSLENNGSKEFASIRRLYRQQLKFLAMFIIIWLVLMECKEACQTRQQLKFLAMFIIIWLVLMECKEACQTQGCILGLGDYTTKGMKPDSLYYDAVTLVARKLASLVTKSGHCLASQYCRWEQNVVVSDLLSFQGTDRKSEVSSKTPTST